MVYCNYKGSSCAAQASVALPSFPSKLYGTTDPPKRWHIWSSHCREHSFSSLSQQQTNPTKQSTVFVGLTNSTDSLRGQMTARSVQWRGWDHTTWRAGEKVGKRGLRERDFLFWQQQAVRAAEVSVWTAPSRCTKDAHTRSSAAVCCKVTPCILCSNFTWAITLLFCICSPNSLPAGR